MSSRVSIGEKFLLIDFKKLTILWVLIAFGLSFASQLNFDTARRFRDLTPATTYNIYIEPQPLSSELTRAISFGSTEFMADYYWLKMIQYYGGGEPYGKYRKLAELFNTITELSPKFLFAYQTGLIILPGEGFPDEAIALGQKGQKNLPNSWEIPYYTGLVYHINKKDYIAAAHEFEKAAEKPGAPPITKLFIGIYYKQANQREIAYQIFKTVYETSDNDFVKERAQKYASHFEIIFLLEDKVKLYHDRYKIYPKDANELVAKKYLPEVPVSPLGLGFSIDQKTGEIQETKAN